MGKGIIILSVAIISSISFILGFFVGKSMKSQVADQSSVVKPLQDTVPENIETEVKEPSSQQTPQSQALQTAETQKPEIEKINIAQETREINKPRQAQEPEQNRESRRTKETEKSVTAQDSKKERETQKPPKAIKYTVQIGAFKNDTDADTMKVKYSKKGYKPFIVVSTTKKHEKLYKVMIGEFQNRKEAELLSVKIKKAEGLQTFVTFKTG
jgi:cell division septation protein DedD